MKKRSSANSAERAAWQTADLLFISNYGDQDERRITLAHFTQNETTGDLPTLRVLGWDGDDTNLRLDYVAREMRDKFRWPKDAANESVWRHTWASAFTEGHREIITTSKRLAERLADLASGIRKKASSALAIESQMGPLRKIMKGFQQALIHDLTDDDFADMYAQTIAYGLLSARVSRPAGLIADDMAHMIPVTNPFLKELLETFLRLGGRRRDGQPGSGIDFDELGVNEVVELLREAKMEAVLLDFGDRNPDEDPVIHFYELFLKEYDPKKRMQRGVFYTPQPVVSYIVRSVHELLQTEFSLEDGLASTITWGEIVTKHPGLKIPDGVNAPDPFVVILDPATGTATFLVQVIEVIHSTLKTRWRQQRLTDAQQRAEWNEYVPKHLLPRVHGFELMMAPYAIAHMKVGLKLYETGYRFGSNERARIYLTNALEPASDQKEQREFEEWLPALAHEAQAVSAIKRHQRFTVVIGNPPYSVLSANLSESNRRIVDPYRYVDGKKIEERSMLRLEMHLQDDYVKFLAFSQGVLGSAGCGTFGFITNNGYLDNLTLRGVRFGLQEHFPRFVVLNLHGSRQRNETVNGEADENIFDIEQGVAIFIGSANPASTGELRRYADLKGSRERKMRALQSESISTTGFQLLTPRAPQYFLVPRNDTGCEEYESFPSLVEALPVNISGIVTAHDDLVIDFDDERLRKNAATLRDRRLSEETVRDRLSVKDNAGWKLASARVALQKTASDEPFLREYAYRPFDTRRIYYHPALVWCDRRKVMSHILASTNVALATCRQLARLPREHVFVTRELQDDCFISNRTRERSYHFPLRLHGDSRQRGMQAELSLGQEGAPANLSSSFVATLASTLGTTAVPTDDVFQYIYAIFFSPAYRTRYTEFLKIDFPRIPLPAGVELFRAVARLGGELVALHLLESPRLDRLPATYTGPANPEVEKISYGHDTVWLDKAQARGFKDVPEAVWNFHIGCYLCEKWLKDRKGRTLSKNDIAHYQKIVVALSETIRLMKKIDEVIEEHGGWPGAFQSNAGSGSQAKKMR